MPRNPNRPSNEELRQLIGEHPEYRSPTYLGRHLNINPDSAGRYLRGADIPVMTNREVRFLLSGRSNAKTLSPEELRQLVLENPRYSHPMHLKDYLDVSLSTAVKYLRQADIKPIIPDGFISIKEAGESSGIHPTVINSHAKEGQIKYEFFGHNARAMYVDKNDFLTWSSGYKPPKRHLSTVVSEVPEDFISVDEASQLTGFSKLTIGHLATYQSIRTVKHNRRRYYNKEDLENYIAIPQDYISIKEASKLTDRTIVYIERLLWGRNKRLPYVKKRGRVYIPLSTVEELIIPDGFVSVNQAAEISGYTDAHVLALIEQGKLRSTRIGKFKYVSREDLENYTKSRIKPIRDARTLQEFVEKTKEARDVLSIGALSDRYLVDALEILSRLFPERIDPQRTIGLVPHVIESLGYYTGSFLPSGSVRIPSQLPVQLLEELSESLFQVQEFEDLLFNVVRDSYMISFNRQPSETTEAIKEVSGKIQNEYSRGVLDRVLRFYEEILEYEIPGITPILERVG